MNADQNAPSAPAGVPERLIERHRWSILLALLVVLIVADGFDGAAPVLDQLGLIGLGVLFLGVVGATDRRTWLRLLMGGPVLVWFAMILLAMLGGSYHLDVGLVGMSGVLLFGCLTISFRQLFVPVHSEYERLSSGVFGYLLIAMIWGLIYWRIEVISPGAFNLPDGVTGQARGPFVYFSMITMTTVGYGEITPAASLPRTLAGLQAVASTMFVAIFIGRIVGRLK